MAFDECMLGHVFKRPDDILLRLYTWRPGAITIGFNQRTEKAVNLSKVGTTPLLRRITGGRAVYHDVSEITYSIALNVSNPLFRQWVGSVQDVYLRLAKGLQLFLAEVGTVAQIVRLTSVGRPEKMRALVDPCFASTSRYELSVGGTKVIASAQRQVGSAVLQHGSVKLRGVVRHPALAGVGEKPDPAVQPHERSEVERMALQFAAVFGNLLGVTLLSGSMPELSVDPLDGVTERWRLIQKSPLTRRDVIERYTN